MTQLYFPILLLTLFGLTFQMSGCASLRETLFGDSPTQIQTDDGEFPTAPPSTENQQPRQTEFRHADRDSEILLGMPMSDVRSAWGDPADVEIAGDASMGNEKWVYPIGLETGLGAYSQRVVYFEHGQVAGWKMDQ